MKPAIHALGLALAALFSSAPVAAQDADPPTIGITLTGSDMLAASVDRAVTGLFVDSFSFTPPSVEGLVSVTFEALSGPITFFSALLNDQGFSNGDGGPTFTFASTVSADMPLSLTVLGFAGDVDTLTDASGSYRTTVEVQSVAVIPEPSTYALMFAGLVAVGALARRRRGR